MNAVHSTGLALRAWREGAGLSQKDAATHFGVPARTYQDYERDLKAPGSGALAAFVRAGLNANWLLTGEGPMLLKDLQSPAPAAPPRLKINTEALAAIMDGAMKGLPGAPMADIVKFAVDMYMNALESGLITPDGVGKGASGKAA